MALVACPECGQKISSEAATCPSCGMPIDPTSERFDYVTGERIGYMPRPAAHLARRPFRYPSPTGLRMMMGGAAAVILGSFMPWIRLGPLTISGMSADGPITLAIGIAMALIALSARASQSNALRYLVMVGALASIMVASIDTHRLVEGGLNRQLIGPGLSFIFFGALVAFIGAFLRER